MLATETTPPASPRAGPSRRTRAARPATPIRWRRHDLRKAGLIGFLKIGTRVVYQRHAIEEYIRLSETPPAARAGGGEDESIKKSRGGQATGREANQ